MDFLIVCFHLAHLLLFFWDKETSSGTSANLIITVIHLADDGCFGEQTQLP